jgi:3-deoxy-D-manno-octulosonic-acid transferase
MDNFSEIVADFLGQGGAVQVRDAAELETTIAELLADTARREALGRNAAAVVHKNLGAIDRTVDMIVKQLEGGEMYVAPKRN